MKTSVKTFAYAAIASIAFLACDTGTNNNTELQDDFIISSSSSVLSSSSSELLIPISSSSSIIICIEFDDETGKCRKFEGEIPYDPENIPSKLSGGVERWIKEQLASGKNDRVQVVVADYDIRVPEYEYEGAASEVWYDGGECGGICYYDINSRKVYNVEEYNEWLEKYHQERKEKRRVSPMIGEFVSDVFCPSGTDKWLALMTAEEIVKLTEKYKGLSIEFPSTVIDG